MNRIFLLLAFLLPFLLSANDGTDFNAGSTESSLASIYGLPETNLMGVNVIEGDYNYSCIDFDLPGSDPLIFQRMYSGSQKYLEGFYHGWTHNLSSIVTTYSTGRTYNLYPSSYLKPEYHPEKLHVALVGSLSGSIPFSTEIENRDKEIKIGSRVLSKGVTNCNRGYISGRTNLKNLKVNYSKTGVEIINPDGTQLIHTRTTNERREDPYFSTNYLTETKKPNGTRRTYSSAGKKLKEINTLTHDGCTANQIQFEQPNVYDASDDYQFSCNFTISGHSKDGKSAKYHIHGHKAHVENGNRNDKVYLLSMSAFESSHLPSENYQYMKGHDGYELLTERSGAHHRTLIDYYAKKDKVYLYGYEPKKIDSFHFARGRVQKIQVAVNNSTDLQTAYTFAYYKGRKSNVAFTDVYNAQNHLTRFHYSTKDFRLNCVEKFAGTSDRSVYRRDRMKYGAEDTPLEGDILYKTVESGAGKIHFAENYSYDDRGNVLKKKCHYRTFTNAQANPISLEYNQHPNGGEIKSTVYTYNELNLPTSEDDGKTKTLFTYHTRKGKLTNLPQSKLVKKGQKILLREFCDFDKNAACTLKTEDDGSGESSKDLTGVHCRKSTRMINREGDFAGLPLEIDVWGSNGEKEQRISRTVLKYDSHGYVENEKHYDANNQFVFELNKVRDLQGNITCETDALGQTTNRRYNRYGSLLEEHGPSSKYYTKCSYDWLQRPVVITRKCSDGIHLTTTRSYDLDGNLTQVEDTYGSTTKTVYDEKGCPVEIIHPPIRTAKGKWIRPRELKQYNFLGHLIAETDPKGAVTLYTPNSAGMPLKIKYPDGTCEKFSYSIHGELLEKIHTNGSKVVYTYDAFSRPIVEETYDRQGNLLKKCSKKYAGLLLQSETDGEGLKKSYAYDYAGRIVEIRQGKALTKYVYDSVGRVKEEQRYLSDNENDVIITQFSYDKLNRVIKRQELDEERKAHSVVRTGYDADGNVISLETNTHAGKSKTTHTYDPRGNLSSTKDPLGNVTRYIHRYDFFFEGKNLPCLETIDPAGVKTTTVYDAHGHLISTQVHSPFGELLSDMDLFYDLKGNLIRKEQHLPTEDQVTLYGYDTRSRLIEQVDGYKTQEQITTTFVYNHFGELSKTLYSDGSAKHSTYDALGRLSEEWSDDKSVHYRYTYNKQDLLETALNCNTKKKTTRRYSPEGNLLSEILENGLEIRYEYDRTDRIVKRIYPDNSCMKQTYNPISLTKIERIKNNEVIYEANFNQFLGTGKPQKITFPGMAGILSLEYDLLNRPIGLSSPHYKEEDISYDCRGLLKSKKVNGDKQVYDHDFLQQLTSEKTALYSHTYVNDALQRQISIDGVAQKHNAVNQLTRGVHDAYKYDAKGRRIKDSATTYTYDKFDRLIGIEKEKSTWKYTYDAFNRKMSRTYAGETVYYLYDGQEEIGSFNHKKECIDLKIDSGSFPIALELGKEHYSPLISSQGHIVGLVEMETGDLADYSPLTLFGKDLSDNPLSPWRFCGKRHEEAALGLIDFGHRFYHTLSGQWLTQDPLGESDGPNLYAYVNNNPGCFVDRFGLFGEGWSLSDAWDCFTDACSSAWDSFTDYCGACQYGDAWNDMKSDYRMGTVDIDCSRFNNFSTNEHTSNIVESPVADPASEPQHNYAGDIASIGLDVVPVVSNLKSLTELWTGRDAVTGAEVHRGIALIGLLPFGKAVANGGKLLYNGAKVIAKASKALGRSQGTAKTINAAKNIFGFTARILPGNKDWGLKHILMKHGFGSKIADASIFVQGIGVKEITELANKAYNNSQLIWTIQKNGLKSVVIDTGKIIGISRQGPSTSLVKIVFDGNTLHTMYPYIPI